MALPRGTTGSLGPTFVSARPVGLAVRRAFALALRGRFPTGLSPPSRASVTFWEATAPVELPAMQGPGPGEGRGEMPDDARVVFHRRLHRGWRPGFAGSHLSYTCATRHHCKAAVKVHGVFPSDRGNSASSRRVQFRRVGAGDSGAVVTPFVQVGTYPTRNFATLGPL